MDAGLIGLPSGGTPLDRRVTWDRIVPGIGPYVVSLTASATLLEGYSVVKADATAGAITLTLPPARQAYRDVTIKKVDASANAVVIDGDGSETIDGAATVSLTIQNESRRLGSDGSNWFIL